MKINDILNMTSNEFNKLDEKQLTKTLSYMNKVANDRIDRLNKNKDYVSKNSYALNKLEEMGVKKFTIPRDSTFNNKRNLFMKVKSFLDMQTSTISGIQEHNKNAINAMQKIGINIDEKNINSFFGIWGKAYELHNKNKDMKYEMERYIANVLDMNLSDEEILLKLEEDYEEIYKEMKDREEVFSYGFYDID